MKWLIVILFLAAGCLDTAPDDPDDPSMGMPVPGSDVDEMEDLPEDTSTPSNGFAPQSGHQEASNEELSLVGDLRVVDCDEDFCIHAVATNEGSQDLYITDICGSPWDESMQQRDSQVQKSEPMAQCLAWGVRAMAPGEMLHANFTWDGRLWDDDAQEYRDAPEDSYTWSIHFRYYDDADGNGGDHITIDFPVIIGET